MTDAGTSQADDRPARFIGAEGGTVNEILSKLMEEELALVSELESAASSGFSTIPIPAIPIPLY
jgi:hypothetical protein